VDESTFPLAVATLDDVQNGQVGIGSSTAWSPLAGCLITERTIAVHALHRHCHAQGHRVATADSL
jgi:hypothetical protein